MPILVKNPHSVLAALKTRPEAVLSIALPGGPDAGPVWKEVAELSRQKRVPTHRAEKEDFRPQSHSRGGEKEGRVGGAHAQIRDREPVSLQELFLPADSGGSDVWLALDQVQDPQNLGAIFRMAAFFGIKGILLTQDRSAALTGTVYDVSCGGVEYVPFSIEVNFQRAIEAAKKSNLWVLGTSEHAQEPYFRMNSDRNWLLVMGNEESGIRKLTEKSCDLMCTIPSASKAGVTSLNVSVATSVILSHLTKKIESSF